MAKTYKLTAGPAILILAFMALVFGGVGGAFTWFSYDFSDNAEATTGSVMSVARSYSDGSTTYKPTIAYVDWNGVKQSGETFLSSSSYNYSPGAQVEILYDLRDPSSLRINNWFALWGFGLIFLAVGIVLFVAMLVAIIKRKSSSAGEPRSKSKYGRTRRQERIAAVETKEDHDRETNYTPTVRR